ncbi:MAG TPA: fumarylacetoacetate hydrolase, partial [Burkholderiaceae bacterium]|nr:fumarylacetoacetate hydrolase [Burkholderiaceae bacterium]
MQKHLDLSSVFPNDYRRAALVGRIWVEGKGPVLVQVRDDGLFDLSALAATSSQLLQMDYPAGAIRHHASERIADTRAVLANSAHDVRDPTVPWFLAPCDLQAVKAAGVTFVASMLERVIEEQARGDASKADAVRQAVTAVIGDNLSEVQPGSPAAEKLKEVLIAQGAWSQYLEVGIGPDAEVFTKAQPMSAVGVGAEVGIHPRSEWNNPEPEIVLAVNSRGD